VVCGAISACECCTSGESRPQVSLFKSLVWPDRESNPTNQHQWRSKPLIRTSGGRQFMNRSDRNTQMWDLSQSYSERQQDWEPCFKQDKKQIKDVSGPSKLFSLCGCHGKHNKYTFRAIPQNKAKNKTFPLNQNLTCANYGIYVATCVMCCHVGQTANKLVKKLSLGTNLIYEGDTWRHYTLLHRIVNEPPIHDSYTVTFVE